MELIIENVGKRYRHDFWGLRDLSLSLEPGVLGLLGPNGAGKSTLMRILATVTKPTAGRVLWNRDDIARYPDRLRAVLGYLPQDFGVYPNLNAVEFLEYMAAIKGLDGRSAHRRIDELLEAVNLHEARRRPLGGYSGGMKQRVGIAQALLNDPLLLIVDEPTAGLDPEERVAFRSIIADLASNRIVILSTHIVSDVEATATSIALLNKGHCVLHDSPERILQSVEGKVWTWTASAPELSTIRQKHIVSSTAHREDGTHVRVVAGACPDDRAEPAEAALEDAYLYCIQAAHAPAHLQ